ncbi:MAG: hypothetical protein IKC59_08940, partial [Clostridia bacterium]|nr:hypothetical protein [Clostridia bacterium]
MGLTDSTYKKIKGTAQQVKKKTAGKEQQVSDVFTAAEKLLLHTVAHHWLIAKGKKSTNAVVKKLVGLPSCLGGAAIRWNLMTELAGAIDRLLEENPAPSAVEEAPAVEETAVEETVAEAPVAEEPAVEAFAEVVPEAAEVVETAAEQENDDEDEDDALDGIDTSELEFIDVMAEPDRYREMLEMEARGEVRLVSRYRRSSRSRMIQSRDNVQEYYSILKNALMSYKGVKDRLSWDYDSFNKGRVKVAKITAKTRTVYLYLAIDPATLADTKYFFDDMSDKKKYAEVPVLMKIKGERKLKHALELIEKVCGEQLGLPAVKDFVAQDYAEPYRDTATLVQEGLIKQ